MNFVKSQIYRNIIDSLILADNCRNVEHMMPMVDDDKILEEMTYELVSLLRQKKNPINIEQLSPKQYALLMETKNEETL